MVAAARCLYHATIYSSINRLPFKGPALLSVPVRPCPQFRRVGYGFRCHPHSVWIIKLDARGSMAAPRRCGYGDSACGLDRLSHGSGWRSYLYPFISPAPAGSLLAAHALPGPAIPECGVPVPPLQTRPGAAAR